LKIGELARLSGCSVQTIRHYEKVRLLPEAQRSEGNFRLYDSAALEQLLFIKHCRRLNLSLAEIRQLIEFNRIPDTQCNEISIMIDSHIDQVAQRIDELENLRRHLTSLRDNCSGNRTVKQCGILQNLSSK
jgi:Cd(II)/Pb(II)-responsive transcriptional regulator